MSVPNENILRLIELTDKLCLTDNDNEHYQEIITLLKVIIDNVRVEIQKTRTAKDKIKCYENMCSTIIHILKNY